MGRIFTTILLVAVIGGVYSQADTTEYKWGKKRVIIINAEGDTTLDEWDDFDISDTSECEDCFSIEMTGQMQFGFSGYTTGDYSMQLPESMSLMELDHAKSRSAAFNFMWYFGNMDKSRLYVSPGLGLDYVGYRFKNNVNISTQNDTVLFTRDTINNYSKYKLRATYLQVPLVVGVRIGNLNKKPLNLQVGGVVGYNIGGLVKSKFETDGADFKRKIRDDFNFNPFKASLTARLGVGGFGFFANYGLTPLFQENKSPELIPFTVGVQFGGF